MSQRGAELPQPIAGFCKTSDCPDGMKVPVRQGRHFVMICLTFDRLEIATTDDDAASTSQQLCPSSAEQRRQIMRVSALAVGVMEKGVASAYEIRQRPKEKVHQPWLDNLHDQVRQGLTELERLAGDRDDWICGPQMSLADVNAVVAYDFAATKWGGGLLG